MKNRRLLNFNFLKFILTTVILCSILKSCSSVPSGYNKYKKIKHVTIYISNKIPEQVLPPLLFQLEKSGFLMPESEWFLSINNDTILLEWVCDTENIRDEEILVKDFNAFQGYINRLVKINMSIKLGFVDMYFSEHIDVPEREIIFYDSPFFNLKKHACNEKHSIYYNELITKQQIDKIISVLSPLQTYFPNDEYFDFIFIKKSGEYYFKLFIYKYNWENERILNSIKSIVETFKYLGVAEKINIILIDNYTYEEKLLITNSNI